MKHTKLFRRDFTILVLGQIISLFGNAILRFALPLYLLRQTNSSALFGGVTACAFLPLVVFSFLGGGIADRVDKGPMMAALDAATALLVGLCALALGQVPLVPCCWWSSWSCMGSPAPISPPCRPACPFWLPGSSWSGPMRW